MPAGTDAKTRLLDAAMAMIRTRGYAASSVDELCRAAGVTKGAFFHHFRTKEDLGVAAAAHFGAMAAELFKNAPYKTMQGSAVRVLGYVDFRTGILCGELAEFTCLLGTMVQEAYSTHPAIREACERQLTGHAATLEADIAGALAATGRHYDFTPESLALHIQAVLQGAFVLAKATGGAQVAVESLQHLRRYLAFLFDTRTPREEAA